MFFGSVVREALAVAASAMRAASRDPSQMPPALHVDRVSAGYRGNRLALDDISSRWKRASASP